MARKVGSKSEQTFSFNAPSATSVLLVGDFTHWQQKPISLRKDIRGVWRASVPLDPGTYHYRFLVDGQWRDDPQCTLRIPNIFGTHNMVREVSPSPAVVAPAKAGEKKPSRRRTSKSV